MKPIRCAGCGFLPGVVRFVRPTICYGCAEIAARVVAERERIGQYEPKSIVQNPADSPGFPTKNPR